MIKINNKGITTIEVIICFILVSIITISMYKTISSYNEKRILESHKAQINMYKTTLTKTIQDDFVKIGLLSVVKNNDNNITCTLRNSSTRNLEIDQVNNKVKYNSIDYPLPTLSHGSSLTIGSNSNITIDNNVLQVYIEIIHPEFGNKYSINIVSIINYVT